MSEVKKYPIWKQAVEDFLQSEFNPGDILSRQWLIDHLELAEPTTIEEYKKFEIRLMNNVEKLRLNLLEGHCIDLRNVWGSGGYQIIPAPMQTSLAMRDAQESMRKLIRLASRRVRFVDHAQLNDAQRRENADALVKISNLQALATPKKWLSCSNE